MWAIPSHDAEQACTKDSLAEGHYSRLVTEDMRVAETIIALFLIAFFNF